MTGTLANKYKLKDIELEMTKDKVVLGSATVLDYIQETNCNITKIDTTLQLECKCCDYRVTIDNNTYETGDTIFFIVKEIIPNNILYKN